MIRCHTVDIYRLSLDLIVATLLLPSQQPLMSVCRSTSFVVYKYLKTISGKHHSKISFSYGPLMGDDTLFGQTLQPSGPTHDHHAKIHEQYCTCSVSPKIFSSKKFSRLELGNQEWDVSYSISAPQYHYNKFSYPFWNLISDRFFHLSILICCQCLPEYVWLSA